MENRVYLTLSDGTVIDDNYVNMTVKEFDDAIRDGRVTVEPNPHNQEPLRATYGVMPKYLQNELKPFLINTKR